MGQVCTYDLRASDRGAQEQQLLGQVGGLIGFIGGCSRGSVCVSCLGTLFPCSRCVCCGRVLSFAHHWLGVRFSSQPFARLLTDGRLPCVSTHSTMRRPGSAGPLHLNGPARRGGYIADLATQC